ncbi:MAG: hypothetical protein K1V84_01060 [Muribaculaceae bacterium]
MTFKEIYAKVKEEPKPDTPSVAFIKEICRVTHKTEPTVRRWLSDTETCSSVPDALTQEVLASHFNTTAAELFPAIP